MDRKKVEHISRNAALRYNKNTLCSIIQDLRITNIILSSGILPEGFFLTHKDLGYSSIMNRVIAMPKYNYSEVLKFLDRSQKLTPVDNESTSSVETRLGLQNNIENIIRESILVIYLSNFTHSDPISNLLLYDVIIEDLDVMGTIEGRVVPKTGNSDPNSNKKLDD